LEGGENDRGAYSPRIATDFGPRCSSSGRLTVRTPFLSSASTAVSSTLAGSVTLRLTAHHERSRRWNFSVRSSLSC